MLLLHLMGLANPNVCHTTKFLHNSWMGDAWLKHLPLLNNLLLSIQNRTIKRKLTDAFFRWILHHPVRECCVLFEVQHSISQRVISRCPSRPRAEAWNVSQPYRLWEMDWKWQVSQMQQHRLLQCAHLQMLHLIWYCDFSLHLVFLTWLRNSSTCNGSDGTGVESLLLSW